MSGRTPGYDHCPAWRQVSQNRASWLLASSHGVLMASVPVAVSHHSTAFLSQGTLGPLLPQHLPSPVLVLQEVFLPQVLVDPARSEDGCGEAVLPDHAQRLQEGAVSSMGQARQSPCHPSCPCSPQVPLAPQWGMTQQGCAAASPFSGMAALGSSNFLFMYGQHSGIPHSLQFIPRLAALHSRAQQGLQWELSPVPEGSRAALWPSPVTLTLSVSKPPPITSPRAKTSTPT